MWLTQAVTRPTISVAGAPIPAQNGSDAYRFSACGIQPSKTTPRPPHIDVTASRATLLPVRSRQVPKTFLTTSASSSAPARRYPRRGRDRGMPEQGLDSGGGGAAAA
ncbi:hypothetical protein GCM10022416_03940 [Actinomadura keratinilytica]|uniref:Uncharacterized protein n=1 Tax=Actinomadura keratinilytica TaxID=547461 RepID=A0ABP7XZF6_9ACTN